VQADKTQLKAEISKKSQTNVLPIGKSMLKLLQLLQRTAMLRPESMRGQTNGSRIQSKLPKQSRTSLGREHKARLVAYEQLALGLAAV
jgi:hypothetical protein